MPQLVRENVNNEIKNNDLIVHEEEDLTNAYESHAPFFTDIDTSNKAKNKRESLRRTYFRGYSNKMTAVEKTYDVEDERNQTPMKKEMENRNVSRGFLEMDGNNPMMAFATEISESVNEPPYFETHIYETSHGKNIANAGQHTFVRFHASVYNRALKRMIRYVFAVGHHGRGLQNDYYFPSTISMRKEVTYDDVKKGFAFVNRYRINRNEDWKLLSTNCNRFAKSVAESMGFDDMARLHDTVSCVGSFNKIREAMYERMVSGNKDLEFFSMEELGKKDLESIDKKDQEMEGDIQRESSVVQNMELTRNSYASGIPYELLKAYQRLVGNALAKDLRVSSVEELKKVKDEYNEAAGKNKFIWFKKNKQRKIAAYEAYRVMKEYLDILLERENEYEKFFLNLHDQVRAGNYDARAYEKERDQLRASVYNNLLAMTDELILVTKGLKESSKKTLKLKGDIMNYKSMITNEGDTSTIAHGGFGNFHSYALDKFLEEGMDEGIYNNVKINEEDKTVGQAAIKLSRIDVGGGNNLNLNGHFLLQRIMEHEGDCIDVLPTQYAKQPLKNILAAFDFIKRQLDNNGKKNSRLQNYMQMLVEKQVGYASSSEVMAWTMVQFIIAAVKDLWKIRMKKYPLTEEAHVRKAQFIDRFFNALYVGRLMQASEKSGQAEEQKEWSEANKSKYRTRYTKSEYVNDSAGNETAEAEEIQAKINAIYDKLKEYADSIMNPARG